MPDISGFHREFVFVHLLGIFAFLLAHGVSAGVLFRIRREPDPQSLRAMLKLSESALLVMTIAGLVILASGVLAGISGNYWTTGRYWLWASLAIFVGIGFLMTPLARNPLNRLRDAIDAEDAVAIEAAKTGARPLVVAAIGFGGIALLTWLMMYKPF